MENKGINKDLKSAKPYTKIDKKKFITKKQKVASGKKVTNPASDLKIGFLGGLNEIGKNMTVIEYGEDMIIIDCGLAFPDSSLPGVDIVIPDFTYIEQNKNRLKGIFITHGHEDHIGALSFLLKVCNAPIYSARFTLGLIEYKLREAKVLDSAKLNVIVPGDIITLGKISVEAIHMNHSIPDALAFAIRTPAGVVVHTGDFKIDSTPIDGEMADLSRLSQIGRENVLCLMSDSTNSERPGYTASEKIVGETFASLFRKADTRRIVVATFSSNVHRIQQIINVAHSLGRKVAISGRSLENVVEIGQKFNYLNIPEGILIDINEVKLYRDEELVIITTGSQGEAMSALSRMASRDHKKVFIGSNDYIIISAKPIPGNEKTVSNVINDLMRLGAYVVYEQMYDVHVSGHACQEEQKLILGLLKPKYFIPVHGEYRHLRFHADTAHAMGIPDENTIIASNGTEICFKPDNKIESIEIPSGKVYVDGYGVGDVGNSVLRDRRLLSQDGFIIVSVMIDSVSGFAMDAPEILSRGFVYVKDSGDLFEEAKNKVISVIDKYNSSNNGNFDSAILKNKINDGVSRLMYEKTKRTPIILTIINEI